MQNDDITWGILNRRNCCYKIKSETKNFCRNEFNVTGLCMRKACPLANSQYATVREHKGKVFLYIRKPEDVYTPEREWKRVPLAKKFIDALQQIEDELVFWPKYYKTKCRQRFLKITQYLARMRKMQLTTTKKLVPVRQKEERRLARKEEKALIAAKLDNEIEKQLLNRLKEGTYERIYNFPKHTFENLIEEGEELKEELEELEEESGNKVTVKEEEEELEEEMDEEVEKELEKGLVRMEREEDYDSEEDEYSDDDEDDYNESDIEQAVDTDSEMEEEEYEEGQNSEEEEQEDEETGQIEYVADFEESDEEEEQQEEDIEDMSERLGLDDMQEGEGEEPARKSRDRRRNVPTVTKYVTGKVLDDKEADEYMDIKYNPKKFSGMTTNQKMKKRRKEAKRKIREYAEKHMSRNRSESRKVKIK